MKKTAIAALLFAGALSLSAQSRFDIATYTPPAGWKVEETPDHVTFTVTDNAAGTFCMAGLYASQPAGGDPSASFGSEWNALVAGSFTAPPPPAAARGTTRGGRGSYAVKRFSLILTYSDGRVKKVALTGLFGANPAPSGDIIYLGRGRFNRRK